MQKTTIHATLYSHGLCSTCRSAPSCTFPRRPGIPIMECLEFEGELRAESRPARTPSNPPRMQERPTEPGLCGWCDRRASCTFPMNAGGVWFCEEYQ